MKHLFAVFVFALFVFCSKNVLAVSTDTIPTEMWTSTHNSFANLDDVAVAVAVDSMDAVYVTGYEMTASSPIPIFRGWIEKRTSTGGAVWSTTFSSGNNRSEGRAIAYSSMTNSVYVGAYMNRSGVVRRYSTNGSLIWSATVQAGGESAINGITVSTGYITVTGYILPYSSATDIALLLARYTTNGLLVWTTTYNISPYQDIGNSIVEKHNTIYVCGTAARKVFAGTYTLGGTRISTVSFGGDGLNADQCLDLAVDESLAVYLVGYKETAIPRPQKQVGFVQKIGSDGLTRWTTTYTNGVILGAGGYDKARAVAVVSSSVFVTGTITSTNTKQNLDIRFYDTNGLLNWTTSYSGVNLPAADYGTDIAPLGTGFVVTGAVSFTTSTVYATDVSTSTYRGTDGIIRRY